MLFPPKLSVVFYICEDIINKTYMTKILHRFKKKCINWLSNSVFNEHAHGHTVPFCSFNFENSADVREGKCAGRLEEEAIFHSGYL